MFKALLVLSFMLATLARPALADDNFTSCDMPTEIPVNVTPRFDTPSYDFSLGIASIMALSADSHHTIREGLTLGLTRYEPMMQISAPLIGIQMPDGLSCAHVGHVDVTVGYANVTVYIANEIPQGTCGFEQVMGHEQKHIAVNMEILQDYTPRIASELTDYLKLNGSFMEEDPDYAMKLVREKLQAIIDSIVKDMSAENARRQRDVDTLDEYRRVSASCNGQLRGIAAQFMNAQR